MHKTNRQRKKKDSNKPLENYLIGVLSHWIPAEEKKNQGTSRRRWTVVLNNSHCIQYCLKSWSSHLPSEVRKIPLGALLIPRMTMRSIQAAVVYWVFGVSRLQKKKRKNTRVELSNSRFALRKLYHRATGNSNWFKWQPSHLLLWILNPNIIIHVHSPYSSLQISFSTDKENSFNNQCFLGWRSFRLFSWS